MENTDYIRLPNKYDTFANSWWLVGAGLFLMFWLYRLWVFVARVEASGYVESVSDAYHAIVLVALFASLYAVCALLDRIRGLV